MGGEGSGRKPDPIKQVIQKFTPIASMGENNNLFLPNNSGVQNDILEGQIRLGQAGSVLFLDNSGHISEDNSNFFYDDANNRLGIGIIPSIPFQISIGNPVSIPQVTGMDVSYRANAVAGSNTGAGLFQMEITNTASAAGVNYGISARTLHYGSANITGLYGLIGGFYNAIKAVSGGIIDNAMGIYSRVIFNTNSITGTITNAVDFRAAPIDAKNGIITNAYNLYTETHLVNTGTLTNAYGIWLEPQINASTRNMGIVLDGDNTAGSDVSALGSALVLGDGQDAAIYYDGTDLVLDSSVVGTGVLRYGTHSNIGAETITGYITIKDDAGNLRKLAVVS